MSECEAKKSGKIDEEVIHELTSEFQIQENMKKDFKLDPDEIKEVLQILIDYERELSGLIALVGVDTEY